MSRLPIRLRLTLTFALVMAVVLVATGGFVYVRVGDALLTSVDQTLRSQATEAATRAHDEHGLVDPDASGGTTLAQSLDIAADHPADAVGVVVDTYHVWWDPDLETSIARAGREGRISSYQICDWTLPLAANTLNSRGFPGDGYIDFPTITRWVVEAGYTGDIEVEIFNEDIWALPAEKTVEIMSARYAELVLPYL